MVLNDRTRGDGHTLKHGRVSLNIRKPFHCVGDCALADVALWCFYPCIYLDMGLDNRLHVAPLEQGGNEPDHFQRFVSTSTIM